MKSLSLIECAGAAIVAYWGNADWQLEFRDDMQSNNSIILFVCNVNVSKYESVAKNI